MNLKNTTRRAERDDPYRLPEQDIAPRRMVAEPLRPCSSIRPPRRRALLAPRTVNPPPQPQHGGAGRAGPRPLCPLPAVVLSRILRVFPPRLWPARRQRWRGDARRRRVGGPSVGRRRSFRGGAGATDGTKNATWFLVKRKESVSSENLRGELFIKATAFK